MQYLWFSGKLIPPFLLVGFCREPIIEMLLQNYLRNYFWLSTSNFFFQFHYGGVVVRKKRRVFKLKIKGARNSGICDEGGGFGGGGGWPNTTKCMTRPNPMRWCGHAKVRHKWIDVGLRYLWLPKLLDKVLISLLRIFVSSKTPPPPPPPSPPPWGPPPCPPSSALGCLNRPCLRETLAQLKIP
jgi:hypothetical protein